MSTDGKLSLKFFVPIRLGRGENNREHPQARAKRVKAERQAVFYATLGAVRGVLTMLMPTPVVVTLTRVSPGPGLDAHDNLPGACKGVVDELAAILGINDRDPRVSWRYQQERGDWGVWVHITAQLPGPEVVAPKASRSAAPGKYAQRAKKPRDFTEALLQRAADLRRAGLSSEAAAKEALTIPVRASKSKQRAAAAGMDRALAALATPAYVAPRRSP